MTLFLKPPTTIQQQIELLQARGIIINDIKIATHYLQFIGYYRLSGYSNYFKIDIDKYRNGTTFEDILKHYIFDRKLRILVFDAIERIEIALKSSITATMLENHGAFWFNKKELFVTNKGRKYIDGATKVLKSIRASTIDLKEKDLFLKHYYEKYSAPEIPPSWIVMETLSMGAVSKILSLLNVEIRKEIAAAFQIKERHLLSWIRSLTYTRNLCAHHARLWNRVFTLKVEADKTYPMCNDPLFHKGKIYSHITIIAILLEVIAPDNQWEQHIIDLINLSKPHNYLSDMGFPLDWNGFNLFTPQQK